MTFSPLNSAITGPLFTSGAMQAVFSDRARIAAMLAVEEALARAQARFGLAPEALAEAIAAISPDDLDLDEIGKATANAGVPTIPFVKAVQKRLPAEYESSFHKGATTQDILDTALVLQLRDGFRLIEPDLAAVLQELQRLAEAHRRTPCVGRTYGQHAAPITFGFKAAVWLAGIAEAGEGIARAKGRLLVASLGGPVGTLAALGEQGPRVADSFADLLGLRAPAITWHTRRAGFAEGGTSIAVLLGALGKMAVDVAHLCTTEVGEVAEPHVPGRGGSSSMPHKRNPVSSTIIIAAHQASIGQAALLLQALSARHERPAGLWHAEWGALPTLFGLTSGALRESRLLCEGLEIYPKRMAANLDATRGLLFADAAAGRLAHRLGREAAHEAVERAADEVRTSGRSLQEVLCRDHGPEIAEAFDLAPAIEAAQPWIDRAIEEADRVVQILQSSR
ncbi:3-carboxy-cis,cis-muconate cycloisomerase [Microvirga massiliensis]|uniref:3-carboxy-cis,cis-muconate cycloisomerase n=1 Tax=Microvirga massiliensis TaxID=1033741 RepID=UPI00062BBCAF|nr:3-carboxy-cis,cis-muconate cycloisomerase [Microvirga massiliensis]